MRMTSKWRAIAEREELLTQRYFKFIKKSKKFCRLNWIHSFQSHLPLVYFRFRPNDTTRVSIEDCELFLHDRLQSSHSAVDELISHGSAILEQIRSQGIGLRGIKRKVLDIGQTVRSS